MYFYFNCNLSTQGIKIQLVFIFKILNVCPPPPKTGETHIDMNTNQPPSISRKYKQDLDLSLKNKKTEFFTILINQVCQRVHTPHTYSSPKHPFLFCLLFFQPHSRRLLCIEWHDLQALLRFLSSCSHLIGTHALTKAGPPRFCSYLLFNNSISAG